MPKTFSPELFSEESKERMKSAIKSGDNTSLTKAQILRDDMNYVGEGGRVVVAAIESDPDVLAAISLKEVSPSEAKTVYYNHRILRILFPYNFPKIFASFGRSQQKGVSINFRESCR